MKEVFVATGIIREHICRYLAELRDLGQVCKVRVGECPITGQNGVGFYTTNSDLFVETPQLDLFTEEGGSNA